MQSGDQGNRQDRPTVPDVSQSKGSSRNAVTGAEPVQDRRKQSGSVEETTRLETPVTERTASGASNANMRRIAEKSVKWMSEEEFAYLWADQGLVRALGPVWEQLVMDGYRSDFRRFLLSIEPVLKRFLIAGDVQLSDLERDLRRPKWWI